MMARRARRSGTTRGRGIRRAAAAVGGALAGGGLLMGAERLAERIGIRGGAGFIGRRGSGRRRSKKKSAAWYARQIMRLKLKKRLLDMETRMQEVQKQMQSLHRLAENSDSGRLDKLELKFADLHNLLTERDQKGRPKLSPFGRSIRRRHF